MAKPAGWRRLGQHPVHHVWPAHAGCRRVAVLSEQPGNGRTVGKHQIEEFDQRPHDVPSRCAVTIRWTLQEAGIPAGSVSGRAER